MFITFEGVDGAGKSTACRAVGAPKGGRGRPGGGGGPRGAGGGGGGRPPLGGRCDFRAS